MPGETCGCLFVVLALLGAVFVGVALLYFPTRRKRRELEYALRQQEEAWKGEKHKEKEASWDQVTPE
ncbi:MAG: hypothetical protein AB1505_11070 [Candidatus Latescibacterota bacterium]